MSAELTVNAPQRRPHEYYSPERKAEVLALLDANNGNVTRTAEQTGIFRQTIQFWIDNSDRYASLLPKKQEDLANIAENNAKRLGLSINTMDLSEVPLNHQATAFGIMVDKMQLLRNQPTSITEHVNSDSITVVLQSVLNELTLTD